jgi:CubicO group peptidase (beta-lactamase class C family)
MLLLSAAPIAAWAQNAPRPDRYTTDLQPYIERLVQREHIAGMTIAVVEENRVIYEHAFGSRDLRKSDEPTTPESLFHIASITKPFVATAIMQLVEQGKISLDAPVTKYLPYFRMADDRYKLITVRQILNHTSGIPDVHDYEWDKPQYDDGAAERYVRSMSALKLEFDPGARFKYSNMAFDLLGDLIAKVSGDTFEHYVQHHILIPLGMTKSTLLMKDADPRLLTWGHELDHGATGQVVPSKVFPYNRIHSPSSNLMSNVDEMTHWAIANMQRGEWNGTRILQASTYDELWKHAVDVKNGPKNFAVGLSWFLDEYNGHRIVGHSGGDVGYLTDMEMIPAKGIAVIWLTNCFCWHGSRQLTQAALDVALGLKLPAAANAGAR